MVNAIIYASTFWVREIENEVSLVLPRLLTPGHTSSLLDQVSYPDGPLCDLYI